MKVEEFWLPLKYGPLGLAAIATVLAAFLLWQVIREPQVPKGKRGFFKTYTIFSSVLFVVALASTVLDNVLFKEDRRMSAIRELVGRLDENEVNKTGLMSDFRLISGTPLKRVVFRMCQSIAKLGELVQCTTTAQLSLLERWPAIR